MEKLKELGLKIYVPLQSVINLNNERLKIKINEYCIVVGRLFQVKLYEYYTLPLHGLWYWIGYQILLYLQGCLMCKWCIAFWLPKTHVNLNLTELAILLNQQYF